MIVWINGEYLERAEARVSVFDAGFQHGIGLFETMHVRSGGTFRVFDHLQRLSTSAKALLLTERLHANPLAEAVRRTVERNGFDRARVRLTVTGGDLAGLAQSGEGPTDPTILIVAQPPTRYPAEFFAKGVVVMIADGRVNPLDPLAGHKTLSYWPRIQSLQTAAARGAGEALWFSVTNHLASGAVSNVFLVKDDVVLTPFARGEEEPGSLTAPVLPGITRRAIIDLARGEHLEVKHRMLTIEDILAADEVFLTNSSWGVLPVVGVEQEAIGDGAVGTITDRLRERWDTLVDEETSKDDVPEA